MIWRRAVLNRIEAGNKQGKAKAHISELKVLNAILLKDNGEMKENKLATIALDIYYIYILYSTTTIHRVRCFCMWHEENLYTYTHMY